MAFCSRCGARITDENAKFCNNCGAKLETEEDTSSQIESENISREYDNIADETFLEMFLKRTGRLNRLRYFKRLIVIQFVGGILSSIPMLIVLSGAENHSLSTVQGVLAIAFLIIAFIVNSVPLYCVTIRRLYDLGRSNSFNYAMIGSFIFVAVLYAVTKSSLFIFIIFVLEWYLICTPGTQGANQYGEDPLNYDIPSDLPKNDMKYEVLFFGGIVIMAVLLLVGATISDEDEEIEEDYEEEDYYSEEIPQNMLASRMNNF